MRILIPSLLSLLLLPASPSWARPDGAAEPAAAPSRAAIAERIRAAIRSADALRQGRQQTLAARTLETAARDLAEQPGMADTHRSTLRRLLRQAERSDAGLSVRTWRDTFTRMVGDLGFLPRMEAAMPPGFPQPGPVGTIVRKRYPAYRLARTDTPGERSGFWTLFRHIKRNDVQMTAPVEMTLDPELRMRSMAFLYEHGRQGRTGVQGAVVVKDVPAQDVISIGMRGRRTSRALAFARALLSMRMAEQGLEATGPWRALGYNSPMVSSARRYWEVQIPIRPLPVATPTERAE